MIVYRVSKRSVLAIGGMPTQNSVVSPLPVTASMSPPTRRLYSSIHSGLPKLPTPPSPVSSWSSFDPIVSTTASGLVVGSTTSVRYAGQLKISGACAVRSPTWPSTGPSSPITPVPSAWLMTDSPGVIDSESPVT